MTIKQFAKKYEVTYNLAYTASYNVQPVGTLDRDKDYSEDELYKSLQHLLSERSLKHAEKVGEITWQKSRLRWIRCNKS